MQTSKHPTRFVSSRITLPLFVLSLLALTFATATAREGVVVSWTDGTTDTVQTVTVRAPAAADAIEFEGVTPVPQLRLIDVAQATRPATVIDFRLDEFRPMRLAVYDLEGRLVRELADGLWASGPHRMAWHHENEQGEVLEHGVYVVRMICGDAHTQVALAR